MSSYTLLQQFIGSSLVKTKEKVFFFCREKFYDVIFFGIWFQGIFAAFLCQKFGCRIVTAIGTGCLSAGKNVQNKIKTYRI